MGMRLLEREKRVLEGVEDPRPQFEGLDSGLGKFAVGSAADLVEKYRAEDRDGKQPEDLQSVDDQRVGQHVRKWGTGEQAPEVFKPHPVAQADGVDGVAAQNNIVVLESDQNTIQRLSLIHIW